MSAESYLFPIFERQGKSRTRFKVGYINNKGRVVVEPTFADGTGFHEGLAAVKAGRYWGFIGADGEFVIEPTLPNWCHFHEGLANLCTQKGKWGVIDRLGQFVVAAKYDYVGSFKNGLAVFKLGEEDAGRFGFLDKKGNEVVAAGFRRAGSFSDGLAAVMLGNLWGYIAPSGVFKIPPCFEGTKATPRGSQDTKAGDFVGGLAPVWSGKGYGFIDTSGRFVTRMDFETAYAFHEGRALIQDHGRFGFVDTGGKIIIKPRFSYSQNFSNGLAAVAEVQNGPHGFIDKNGEMVLEPRFFNTMYFRDGLCMVETEKTIGYINAAGHFVWEGPYVEYRSIGL